MKFIDIPKESQRQGIIVPKEEIAHQWEEDYQFMCEHMIYGETPSFTSLIENLKTLNSRIQRLNYQKQ